MPKKYYFLAIVAFLMIPVFWKLPAMLSVFINPEIAAGHPNYVRNYRLLDLAKTLCPELAGRFDDGFEKSEQEKEDRKIKAGTTKESAAFFWKT